MLNEPQKPKNYYRDCSVIFSLALLVGTVTIFLEIEYLAVLFSVGFYCIVQHFWFQDYHQAVREYYLSKQAKNNAIKEKSKPIDVNKNIANYVAAQRQKKANRKWWQFWI